MKVIINSAVFLLGVSCAPLIFLNFPTESAKHPAPKTQTADQNSDILHSEQFLAGVAKLRSNINSSTTVLLASR